MGHSGPIDTSQEQPALSMLSVTAIVRGTLPLTRPAALSKSKTIPAPVRVLEKAKLPSVICAIPRIHRLLPQLVHFALPRVCRPCAIALIWTSAETHLCDAGFSTSLLDTGRTFAQIGASSKEATPSSVPTKYLPAHNMHAHAGSYS